jgi:hypothetical protein
MHTFLESYINWLSELFFSVFHTIARKILFGAPMALEGAVWTFLIGIAFAGAYEFTWFACRRFQRLHAMERGRS